MYNKPKETSRRRSNSPLVFTPSTSHQPRTKMADEKDDMVGRYPVYIIPSDIDWYGPPPVDMKKDPELKERFELLRKAPTLAPLKGLVLGKHQQINEDQHCRSSPLITWTLASSEQVEVVKAEMLADSKPEESVTKLGNFDGCIIETITTFESSTMFETVFPAWDEGRIYCLWHSILDLCHTMMGLYKDVQSQYPGENVRVLLSDIRVRGIVAYRYFKDMLWRSGLLNIGIRTDNVLLLDRKEVTQEPIIAYCALCLKLGTTHSRCAGCKVR